VRPHRQNSTGFLGVYRVRGRFAAAISVNYKNVYLGSFGSPEEAHAAYIKAKRKLHKGNTL
jgi:hypothetical protein